MTLRWQHDFMHKLDFSKRKEGNVYLTDPDDKKEYWFEDKEVLGGRHVAVLKRLSERIDECLACHGPDAQPPARALGRTTLAGLLRVVIKELAQIVAECECPDLEAALHYDKYTEEQ
ncbi:hypothetical protein CMI37_30220 [Candidatus Pacearchaeota archaeon]|nr:hypothetical protein [Candidatus Pacearchaeota archaeon]